MCLLRQLREHLELSDLDQIIIATRLNATFTHPADTLVHAELSDEGRVRVDLGSLGSDEFSGDFEGEVEMLDLVCDDETGTARETHATVNEDIPAACQVAMEGIGQVVEVIEQILLE